MRQIAREHGTDDITLRDLRKAILKELSILEVGHLKEIREPKSTVTFYMGTKSSNKTATKTSATKAKKKPGCVFCEDDHSANVEARYEIVKQKKVMF